MSPTPFGTPGIRRNPAPAYFAPAAFQAMPARDQGQLVYNLRSADLTQADLRAEFDGLMLAEFDTRTLWPPAARMPAGFDPSKIMDLGRDPGLSVRGLHAQGITGKGVAVAIIDTPLLVEHGEYAERVKYYAEREDVGRYRPAEMHGPAVASIAVGKTVGVAPEADLYYLGEFCSNPDMSFNHACLAESIRRMVQVNALLPEGRKIRVLSMSIGWQSSDPGYAEVLQAAREAKAAGMFVVCTTPEEIHGYKLLGLDRDPLADPNRFDSYGPGLFFAGQFFARPALAGYLLLPMDSRTAAAPNGKTDYAFYREGGLSWSVPYLAGLYALAAQVRPEITPEEFIALAYETGRTTTVKKADFPDHALGTIVDPAALIGKIR